MDQSAKGVSAVSQLAVPGPDVPAQKDFFHRLLLDQGRKFTSRSVAGQHSLVCSLAESGAPGEAWRLLEEIRPVYRDVDLPMSWARLCWLEGEITRALGHLIEAAAIFYEVCELFVDRNLGIGVFQASLALAEVYAAGGRRRQVKEILGEVIPLGEALGIRRQGLMARLLYEQAAQG